MKLASFFSGGKDSCYAILKAIRQGHSIEALITIIPHSDESHLLHYHNILQTKLQSESMKIPQIIGFSESTKTSDEVSLLYKLIRNAINYSDNLLSGSLDKQRLSPARLQRWTNAGMNGWTNKNGKVLGKDDKVQVFKAVRKETPNATSKEEFEIPIILTETDKEQVGIHTTDTK